jgi:DNA-binding CsgD family transcriptional regulator
MAAGQITLRDARQAFEIVGECRELWADPRAWRRHLLQRVAALTHSRAAFSMELCDENGGIGARVTSAEDVGWDTESERRTVLEGLTDRPLAFSPLWTCFARAMSKRSELTALQPALIDTPQWHASEMYDRYVRPTRIGEGLMSAVRVPGIGAWDHWCICNDRADRPPGVRERHLVALLHDQIAPLIGRELTTWRDRSVDGLSARRRNVLWLLLDGHSEKAIASAMHRSRPSIHEHIGYLYRHFGVNSRAELAAYFVRRHARPDSSRYPPFLSPQAWVAKRPPGPGSLLNGPI